MKKPHPATTLRRYQILLSTIRMLEKDLKIATEHAKKIRDCLQESKRRAREMLKT